jgi:hypothetical protein
MALTSRAQAMDTLRDGHAVVSELLQGVPDADLERPATIGDGDWSAKDLIGHLATWEALALRSLEEWVRGEVPWAEGPDGPLSAPATGKIDAFNARTIAEHRASSVAEVRRRAETTHQALLAGIDRLSDDEWNAKASYPTPNNRRRHLSTLLGTITAAPKRPFGHAFAHTADLQAFVRSLRAGR